ncbi:hypothetical protein SAMN04488060_0616 [Qipengyuania nanhaisediminis]|uniref:TonB protein C-terminal n=2 Tax=Qipengyuania nanhaisediminis TaxID=604088 RepID=A0A1I5KYP4_9SPHN|nr:hypothetical protein SAMN04488060_0616 [Qipengyuania nanhaisediminis]
MFGRKSLLSLVIMALLAGFSSGASAKEREPELLMPLGPWQLDMGEHKCRLARLFGTDEAQTIFILDQWNPAVSAQWAVAGPPVRRIRYSREASFAFGPDGDAEEFRFTPGTLDNYGDVIGDRSTVTAHSHPLPGESDYDWGASPRGILSLDTSNAASIETLMISQKGAHSFSLRLGPMEKPLTAFNACMENLVEFWGFDLEEQKAVSTPARILNLEKVAGRVQQSYPRDALRNRAQADFHLRLTVGTDGSVEECFLINQTIAKDFDMTRHPCTTFKTIAEAEPARMADGTPVRTFFNTRIVYRMRGNAP